MAMMRVQYLLSKLAEECSELAQASLKAQQFGLSEFYMTETNRESLCRKLADMINIISILKDEGHIDLEESIPDMDEYIKDKRDRVNEYYKYSVGKGQSE